MINHRQGILNDSFRPLNDLQSLPGMTALNFGYSNNHKNKYHEKISIATRSPGYPRT